MQPARVNTEVYTGAKLSLEITVGFFLISINLTWWQWPKEEINYFILREDYPRELS